jgi:hypothetical protein
VQETVERVHRVEGPGGEVQVQDVHDPGVDSLLAAAGHHLARDVDGHDVQALIAEEHTVLTRARPQLEQASAALVA